MNVQVMVMALAVASFLGVGALTASAQDQKNGGPVIVAQNGTTAYHAQLDRLRAAIGQGDQARVNDEMVALLGILKEPPTSGAKSVTDTGGSFSEEMRATLRSQDERAGTSF